MWKQKALFNIQNEFTPFKHSHTNGLRGVVQKVSRDSKEAWSSKDGIEKTKENKSKKSKFD